METCSIFIILKCLFITIFQIYPEGVEMGFHFHYEQIVGISVVNIYFALKEMI